MERRGITRPAQAEGAEGGGYRSIRPRACPWLYPCPALVGLAPKPQTGVCGKAACPCHQRKAPAGPKPGRRSPSDRPRLPLLTNGLMREGSLPDGRDRLCLARCAPLFVLGAHRAWSRQRLARNLDNFYVRGSKTAYAGKRHNSLYAFALDMRCCPPDKTLNALPIGREPQCSVRNSCLRASISCVRNRKSLFLPVWWRLGLMHFALITQERTTWR